MASEGRFQASVVIASGTFMYRSPWLPFSFNVAHLFGPAPGAFTASVAGTDVDLSKFVSAGLCIIVNLDKNNYITVGKWDSLNFHPFMVVLPGEWYPLRLAPPSEELGTATLLGPAETYRIKANNSPCDVVVEAFDS